MTQQARILHEAASQRQHMRVKTAITAEVGGTAYPVEDWSVGGIKIAEFDRALEPFTRLPVTLHFPFEGFNMTFDAEITVRHHNPTAKTLGGAFEEMSPQRLSLLHYVIDAYLAGETVNAGDILQIVERDNSARARASKMPEIERSKVAAAMDALRRNFGLALLLIATIGLLVYVGMNLYARTFTVSGDGAITSPQATVLRSPGPGVVLGFAVRPGDRVQPGTLLGSLQKPDGSVTNLISQCDCVIGERLAEIGAPLAKSAAILSMAPTGGSTRATLIVRLKEIRKVKVGNRVAVTFFNDDSLAMGSVESVNLPGLTDPTTLQQSGLKVPDLAGSVTVRFDKPISTGRIGQPVSGRVRLYRLIPFIY